MAKASENKGAAAPATKADIDELAGMISRHIGRLDHRFDEVDLRFDKVEGRLDRIENLLLREHLNRIERLEDSVRLLKTKVGVE